MASLTDKITNTRNAARPNTAAVSSVRVSGGTTLACDSLTGWPTASKVHFVTYQVDTNSNPLPATQLDCEGIVSGNSITSFTVNDGTDGGNSVGDVVEMLPTAAWGQDLADALTAEHNRDGTHSAITADSITTNAGGSIDLSETPLATTDYGDATITPAKLNTSDFGDSSSYFQIGGILVQFGSKSSAGSGALTTVTFGTAFSSAPIVTCTSTYINPTACNAEQIGTTGFKIEIDGSATQTINWIAVGPA